METESELNRSVNNKCTFPQHVLKLVKFSSGNVWLECLLRQTETHCDVIMDILCDVTCCMDTKHIVVLICGHHVGDGCKQLCLPCVGKYRRSEASNVPLRLVCVGTNWFPGWWIFWFWCGSGGKIFFYVWFRVNHCVTRIR